MSRMVEIVEGRFAHATGAMWLPEERTVLVADAHLGYGWAQRRKGELGPVSDGGATAALEALVQEMEALTIVLLGDIVHAPKPAPQEKELIETTLSCLERQCEVVLVKGNHDRGFGEDFGRAMVNQWQGAGVVAVHGDFIPNVEGHIVMGHFHPAYSLRDAAGANHRMRVFVCGHHATILPAFSPFAAGTDVRLGMPTELKRVFGKEKPQFVGVTGTRAAMIG